MKTLLLLVGKTDNRNVSSCIDEYVGRIAHYMPFEVRVVPDLKNTKNMTEQQQKEREGDLLLKQVQDGDYVVLLDEHGRTFRSIGFAEWIEKRAQHVRRLVFIIGGAYGFSQAVYRRADEQLSLSQMTFSHQLVRLLFVEQVYRACTIIKGEPYHHE